MVWRSISLSVARKQLLVGCREQLGIKDSKIEPKELHSFKTSNWNKKNAAWSVKKWGFFEKIDKNVQFNSLFLGIPKIVLCVCVKQVAFFIWGLKELSVWSSVLFTVSALEMREREAYRKQKRSNVSVLPNKVSALEHDQFMQVSLYTVSLFFANSLA